MRRISGPDTMRLSPIGHYIVGETWAAWCWDATLCGGLFWGHPSQRDMKEYLHFGGRLLDHADMARRFDVITDGQGMESAEPSAFAELARYTVERLPVLNRRVRRHAIIPPPGLLGAAVVGLFPLFNATSPVQQRVARDIGEACALIDSPSSRACAPELAALTIDLAEQAPVLRRLASYFTGHLATASIGRAARGLGVATRSLQRQLAAAGTTFREAHERARIDEARRRLSETDQKLDAIADQLGFSSPTHFSQRFRAVTGERPSDYRARNRVPGGPRVVG